MSFLAGLRFVSESFAPQSRNPFNRDRYFLGGFDQIAQFTRWQKGVRKKLQHVTSHSISWPRTVFCGEVWCDPSIFSRLSRSCTFISSPQMKSRSNSLWKAKKA